MQAYQREQLEQLLRHARQNVPFYEDRLDVVFRPDRSIDWNRWGEIPILKRQELADHREEMLAHIVPAGHGEARDYTTSGSSGLPVTVRANSIAALANRAAELRALSWHGIDYAKNLCTFTPAKGEAMWPDGRRLGPWGPSWVTGTSAGRHLQINTYETSSHILDFLKQSEAEYLVASPMIAYALALEAERLGSKIALEKMLYQGAAEPPAARDARLRVFGASALSRYASKESNGIGHTCPTGPHYHVHAENILVEVLDESDQPCAPGQTGRIVATPFLSTHQPIIRYELGDLVTVGQACNCGRTLPVLQEVSGRVNHVFRFPDGSTSYRRLPQSMRQQLKCGMWQVAQVAPLEIELRYEPLNWDEIGDEASVVEFLRMINHPDVKVSVKRVQAIPLTAAGKLIEYSYEVAS
jgi:phenylacetate-CoA ligase